MKNFVERLVHHKGNIIYDDAEMTKVYVKIHKEVPVNFGVTLHNQVIRHCETFSEKCYVHTHGDVHSTVAVSNWASPNIQAMSIRIMLESDKPLTSLVLNTTENSESYIKKFNFKIAHQKKRTTSVSKFYFSPGNF